MRTPNPVLAQAKLDLKKIQLAQIETRIVGLKAELEAVVAKRDAKVQEISKFETVISTIQSSTTVAK